MPKIEQAGVLGGLSHPDTPNVDAREQMGVLLDAIRQLAGYGAIGASSTELRDPLSSPYKLYVNPYIGTDTFAAGSYAEFDDGTAFSKFRRIENQRLVCGYTPARPFRTINRALIEASIITSKSFLTLSGICGGEVAIELSPGPHNVLNNPSSQGSALKAWPDNYEPTEADLIAFNPPDGGVIAPRGVSFFSLDLRRTFLFPNWVPPSIDMVRVYDPITGYVTIPGRAEIFKVTGAGYAFGFTFFDNQGIDRSHHMLSCFGAAGTDELIEYYNKIKIAFADGANLGNLNPALLVPRQSETQIVAPQPDSLPTRATDTAAGASFYIFNCSIRSDLGLGGVYLDGAKVTGFKSMLAAQFTGTCLMTDLDCWEKYENGNWVPFVSYEEFVSPGIDPDDIRAKPSRRSYHILAVNNAFMQLVSVFTIGQSVGHATDTGAEVTATNSNHSFGGVCALSTGYRNKAFPLDKNWNVAAVKTADNLSGKRSNIKRVILGVIDDSVENDATTITLRTALTADSQYPDQPEIVKRDGYSLKPGSYIWVGNGTGPAWRAQLADPAWDPEQPDVLMLTAPFENEDGQIPGESVEVGSASLKLPNLAGNTIYLRRLVDTRTVPERRFSLQISNTAITRTPIRDFVLQLDSNSQLINRRLTPSEVLLVSEAARINRPGGTAFDAEVTIRRGNAHVAWAPDTAYKTGVTVKHANKHWTCSRNHRSGQSFVEEPWLETLVHMEEDFNAEDFRFSEAPILLFDDDQDGTDASTTLGYDLDTVWLNDTEIIDQYRNAADYLGIHRFLTLLGLSNADAHAFLAPRAPDQRLIDPDEPPVGLLAPSDVASGWGNWPVEFNRPSVLRLYGQALEFGGWGNYTRAIPRWQGEMSPQNRISYYFTNANGGRVYLTGSNEDGYTITPFGLTDTATGRVERVDQVGQTRDQLETANQFESVTTGELTVTGTATIQNLEMGNKLGEEQVEVASTIKAGISEIATPDEVLQSFLAGVVQGQPDSAGLRVLPLDSLPGLRDGILRTLNLLEARLSRLYVHPDVVRAGPAYEQLADYDASLTGVWEDIRDNRTLHEIGNWTANTVPAANTPEAQLGRAVMFNNLKQAFDFLASRNPVGKDSIEIYLYGAGSSTGTMRYNGLASLHIVKGPGDTGVLNSGFIDNTTAQYETNGGSIIVSSAPILSVADVDIDFSSAGNSGRGGGLDHNGSGEIAIWNSRLTLSGDTDRSMNLVSARNGSIQLNVRRFSRGSTDSSNSTIEVQLRRQNSAGSYIQRAVSAFRANSIVLASVRDQVPAGRQSWQFRVIMSEATDSNQQLTVFGVGSYFRYTNYSQLPGKDSGLDFFFNFDSGPGREVRIINSLSPEVYVQMAGQSTLPQNANTCLVSNPPPNVDYRFCTGFQITYEGFEPDFTTATNMCRTISEAFFQASPAVGRENFDLLSYNGGSSVEKIFYTEPGLITLDGLAIEPGTPSPITTPTGFDPDLI